MKLRKDLFDFKTAYQIEDYRTYRKYHRIRISFLDVQNVPFRLLLSRRYKAISIHIYFPNGIYVQYPARIKNHTELNYYVNKCDTFVQEIIAPIFKKYSTTRLPLGIFYFTLDKVATECQLNRKRIKTILLRILHDYQPNRLFFLECLGMLLQEKNKVSKEDEKLLSRFNDYVLNFPSIIGYKPQLDLPNFKFSRTLHPNTVTLTYEEFLETLKGYTDDEVLELIGCYKLLEPVEYLKDIRKILYRLTQRFK